MGVCQMKRLIATIMLFALSFAAHAGLSDSSTSTIIIVYTVCFLVGAPIVLFLAGFIAFFIYLPLANGWVAAMKLISWLDRKDWL